MNIPLTLVPACYSLWHTNGVKIVVNICCLRISVLTVKAMFGILLKSCHLQRRLAFRSRDRMQNGKQAEAKRKEENFYLSDG